MFINHNGMKLFKLGGKNQWFIRVPVSQAIALCHPHEWLLKGLNWSILKSIWLKSEALSCCPPPPAITKPFWTHTFFLCPSNPHNQLEPPGQEKCVFLWSPQKAYEEWHGPNPHPALSSRKPARANLIVTHRLLPLQSQAFPPDSIT